MYLDQRAQRDSRSWFLKDELGNEETEGFPGYFILGRV